MATGIFDLKAGQPVITTVPRLGMQFFRFHLSSDTDTIALVTAKAGVLGGDADIRVSAVPFMKPLRTFSSNGRATLSCPECSAGWGGRIQGLSKRSTSLSINHLSLYWVRTLWIVVYSTFGEATLSVSAVSYENADAGSVYTRAQAPLTYAYFLGSAADASDASEQVRVEYMDCRLLECAFSLLAWSKYCITCTCTFIAGFISKSRF